MPIHDFKVGDKVRIKPEIYEKDYKQHYKGWGVTNPLAVYNVEAIHGNGNLRLRFPNDKDTPAESLGAHCWREVDLYKPTTIIIVRRKHEVS